MYCVWYRKSLLWVEFCSQDEVILACMTDTNGSIEVPEAPFDEFVEMNSSEVVVAEKRMLSKYSL